MSQSAAARAERIAFAVVNGEAAMTDVIEDLRLANREKEVAAAAQALTDFRNGASIWAWPARAPWAGF